ncbi:MAG TPA: hypothetical protein VG942_18340 [Hyphomonadaceae bacterium]|nr:hypothetical protein [Hyphomonadaceae bacterium]
MRLFAILAALALTGCSNPEQQWVGSCVKNGMSKELCECIAKRIPADKREAMAKAPDKVGGWVLDPSLASAQSCFDVQTTTG